MNITRQRERKTLVSYAKECDGWSFPCTASGELIKDEYYDCWIENYNKLVSNGIKFDVEKHVVNYTENALGTCECGKEIELYDQFLGACECPHCGRWHNLFGQLLNNPNTWNSEEDW